MMVAKTRVSGQAMGCASSLLMIAAGVAVTVFLWWTIIGLIVGPLIVIAALFIGGNREKLWVCRQCGHVQERWHGGYQTSPAAAVGVVVVLLLAALIVVPIMMSEGASDTDDRATQQPRPRKTATSGGDSDPQDQAMATGDSTPLDAPDASIAKAPPEHPAPTDGDVDAESPVVGGPSERERAAERLAAARAEVEAAEAELAAFLDEHRHVQEWIDAWKEYRLLEPLKDRPHAAEAFRKVRDRIEAMQPATNREEEAYIAGRAELEERLAEAKARERAVR